MLRRLLLLPVALLIVSLAPAGALAHGVPDPRAVAALKNEETDEAPGVDCDNLSTPSALCSPPTTTPPPSPPDAPPPAVAPKLVAWTSAVDISPFGGFRGGIFVARTDGSDRRQITRYENGNSELAPHGLNEPDDHPSFSSDGKQIVFTSNRADRKEWDIYVMAANGTNVRRLTSSPGLDTEPVFSPDGTKIAFVTARFGGLDIALMNAADGSGVTRLTFDPREEIEPAWRPDGQLLVFSMVLSKDEKDLFTMRPDGTGLRRLTSAAGQDHDATFNPDGTRVVYTTEIPPFDRPFGNVHVLALASLQSIADLTADVNFGAGDPFWSFDGKQIAYFKSVLPTLGPMRLFVMNANGGNKTHIPGEGVVNVHPAIGRVADSDADGTADFLETGPVGVARLTLPRVVRARALTRVGFGWTHPDRWRKLAKLTLTLTYRGRGVGAVRFVGSDRSLSLWDTQRAHWTTPKVIGRRGTLRNGLLALDVGASRFVNVSRKTLRIDLAVRLAGQTAGRTLGIEVSGEDTNGGSERRRLATRLRVAR